MRINGHDIPYRALTPYRPVSSVNDVEGLRATVVDYVPGYRTPAGTGTGMGFARWD